MQYFSVSVSHVCLSTYQSTDTWLIPRFLATIHSAEIIGTNICVVKCFHINLHWTGGSTPEGGALAQQG